MNDLHVDLRSDKPRLVVPIQKYIGWDGMIYIYGGVGGMNGIHVFPRCRHTPPSLADPWVPARGENS